MGVAGGRIGRAWGLRIWRFGGFGCFKGLGILRDLLPLRGLGDFGALGVSGLGFVLLGGGG